jgi:hypothetical protein
MPGKKARFVVTQFPAERMRVIAENVRASIMDRIAQGLDVNDQPAAPLSTSYAKFKARKGLAPIRDWKLTGQTLGHLKVLTAEPNRAKIGFLPGVRWGSVRGKAEKRRLSIQEVVGFLQRKHRQFGLSPRDREAFINAIRGVSFIEVKKSA